MSSRLSSNVGRIINFPRRGKSGGSSDLVKAVLPVAAALTWQIVQRSDAFKRAAGGSREPSRGARAVAGKAAGKGAAPAGKAARKVRRSARYYAITILIVALENPTTRRLLISILKLLRNFM
jgi:hypothetical protein